MGGDAVRFKEVWISCGWTYHGERINIIPASYSIGSTFPLFSVIQACVKHARKQGRPGTDATPAKTFILVYIALAG